MYWRQSLLDITRSSYKESQYPSLTVILDHPDSLIISQSSSFSITRGTPQTGFVGKVNRWLLIWLAREEETKWMIMIND